MAHPSPEPDEIEVLHALTSLYGRGGTTELTLLEKIGAIAPLPVVKAGTSTSEQQSSSGPPPSSGTTPSWIIPTVAVGVSAAAVLVSVLLSLGATAVAPSGVTLEAVLGAATGILATLMAYYFTNSVDLGERARAWTKSFPGMEVEVSAFGFTWKSRPDKKDNSASKSETNPKP